VTSEEISRLETYMRKRFHLATIEMRQLPGDGNTAELLIGDEDVGLISRIEEEGELSYDFSMKIQTDADKLQDYMRDRFKLESIEVRQRTNKDDSAELYIGDEFVGVLFEENDVFSYSFNMSILEYDLEEV
jgi:hypothetical protein